MQRWVVIAFVVEAAEAAMVGQAMGNEREIGSSRTCPPAC